MLPRLICCALIALTLSQFLSVMAVRAQVQHTIIAASGDAAPAGGNCVTFLKTFALNARGDGTTTTPIALEGTAAPGTTGTFASFANIKIGNDGQVADNSTAVVSSDVDAESDPEPLTLDLENICVIDCEGLALIKNLMGQGVRQVNAPLFVAELLRRCEATQGDRAPIEPCSINSGCCR